MLYGTAKYVPIMNEIMPRSTTWVSRIDGFFSPSENHNLDEGYQSNQGKIAIHKGGLFGVGPGKSVQRHFVYASSSDFIFCHNGGRIWFNYWSFSTYITLYDSIF